MDATHQEIAKEIVNDLMTRMGFSATVEIRALEESNMLICAVRVDGDQNLLIGQHGANLAALQHLVRALVRRKTGERFDITVDINDYFAEKAVMLEREADKAIREALESQISVALRPMLPYERKVVHSYISKRSDVVTESIGKGVDRKVLIRPKLSGEIEEEVV